MIEQPDIRPVTSRRYRLARDYMYIWTEDHVARRITVRKGFVSDGASVPRLTWTFTGLRPDGLIRAAALVHDFIYRHGGNMPLTSYQKWNGGDWQSIKTPITRRKADRIFLDLMTLAGMGWLRRRLAYTAVRWFAGFAWNNKGTS